MQSLRVENFAAFAKVDIDFSLGLNLFIGENGTGKTLLMKLPYAVMHVLAEQARCEERSPIFLPARELLTIYPGFLTLYENHYTKFDETWRNTCQLLGALVGRGRLFWDEPETNLNPTVDTAAAVPWTAHLRAAAA